MRRKVLVYRQGSLGDTIVALPCFHAIRRAFPDSEIRVLTNAPVAGNAPSLFSVLAGSGLVDGYFEYSIAVRDRRYLSQLARTVRSWGPDVAVYLVRRLRKRDVLRDAVFLMACGTWKIIGLPRNDDQLHPRLYADGSSEREAERLVRCLAGLGPIDLGERANWDLGLTTEERKVTRRLVAGWGGAHRYIVLCPGAKQAANDWGRGNWHALAKRLIELYPHRLVFLGADADRKLATAISDTWPDRCASLCGRLAVRESAAMIADAALFIGVDSGPMHLAAAVGTPSVAIFSKLNPPGMWFPVGNDIRTLYPYAADAAIASISPDDVVRAIADLSVIETGASKERNVS